MKQTKLFLVAILVLMLNACSSNDSEEPVQLETEQITNLYAPADVRDYQTGEIIEEREFVYFSFAEGTTVLEDDNWDIAFKGTEIIVNSGIHGDTQAAATVTVGTFTEITEVPNDVVFKEDTDIINAIPTGSGNGWYNYNPATHAITPIPGRIILVRTHDGKYAKMEILSYYKDMSNNPAPEDSSYYTFNYVYQNNGSTSF